MRRLILVTMIGVAFVLLPQVGWAQTKEEGIRLFYDALSLHQNSRSIGDAKNAARKYQEALEMLQEVGFTPGVGVVYNNIGLLYHTWGLNHQAVKHYLKALDIKQSLGDRMGEGQTLANLGLTYSSMQQYEKALDCHRKALAIFRALADRPHEGMVLNYIGELHKNQGSYDTAEEFYKKAMSILGDLGDPRLGLAMRNLCDLYSRVGKNDQAVDCYRLASALYRDISDHNSECAVLTELGDLYKRLGKNEKARECYLRALALFRDLNDRSGEAATLGNLGNVFRRTGKYDEAIEHYQKSIDVFGELGNRGGQSAAMNNMGLAYSDTGHYHKALTYYQSALCIRRETQDLVGERETLNNLGILFYVWGQYEKALEFFAQCMEVCQKLNDPVNEAETLANVGNVYMRCGLYSMAAENYRNSRLLFERVKDARRAGMALSNLAAAYVEWGWYDKALESFEKALITRREFEGLRGEGECFVNLGVLHKRCGRHDRALDYYRKALACFRELKDQGNEGLVLSNMGEVYVAKGQHDKALSSFRKALTIFEAIGFSTKWPNDLIGNILMDMGKLDEAEPYLKSAQYGPSLGRLALLRSDYEAARDQYLELLNYAETIGNAELRFTAYTGLGLAWEAMNDYDKAAEYFGKAVAFTEELRASLPEAQREKFFDVRISGFTRTVPYEGLARVLMRMKKPNGAIKASEHTKARVFAETISRRVGGEQFDIPADILKTDREIADQQAALKKQLQKAYEENNRFTIEALEPQIKELQEKLKAHIQMLRDTYPLFAGTKYPEPMDLSQAALSDDEWTLSYDVTDSGVLVYLTRGKELVRAFFKPITRKELDELIRKFREPLEVSPDDFIKKLESFDFTSGKRLSDLLLSHVLPDLPESSPVIVVPDDSLGVLPFEMLVLNDSGKISTVKEFPEVRDARFFGDRNPISYYQSITALTLARTFGKAKKTAPRRMVMADPVFDLKDHRLAEINRRRRIVLMKSMPDKLMSIKTEMGLTFLRLPLTGELAKSLKKLEPSKTDVFVGMKAAKPVLFKKPLSDYGSMVFATHGYFGKDLPGIQESVLILTLPGQPEGQDGFLRMSEVMGLKLNADVVALTACQTGLGRRLTGEGTMGMGRAFQYAGAKAVLMSLWSVTQKSSVKLVESFFRHLKEGQGKLEALQLARKEIRDAGYDHPFFWAPFILVGEAH